MSESGQIDRALDRDARPWDRAWLVWQGLARRAGRWLSALRLSTKAMLLGVGLTSVIILAVFLTLSIEIRNETEELLREALERSERQVFKMREDHFVDLLWVTTQVSANPTLRAAIETYRMETNEQGPAGSELLATVQNELDKVWGGLRHDLLFVTDESGIVLAAKSSSGVVPQAGESLADHPVVQHALDPRSAAGDENFGVVELGGQFFFVGTSPITLQDYVIGTLTMGDRIGNRFIPDLRAFFGGETVVMAGRQVISSTLPEGLTGQLVEGRVTPLSSGEGTVEIGDEAFLITSMSLGHDRAGRDVSLYLLRSFTEALREPNQKLMRTLAVQAAIAILLAALLSWIATRAGLRPLQRFVGFMRNVADTGDYSRRFRADGVEAEESGAEPAEEGDESGSGENRNELALLIGAFNNMIAEIELRDSSIKKAHAELMGSIEALHQKEKQLRQLQKMEAIGLLAGGVAHDFNNILMVISGFSDLALKSLADDHEARESIDEVRKACKTASLLTRQLLAFSSKQVTKPKVITINTLIEELEKILSTLVGQSKPISIRLDPAVGSVLIDPAQMEQVLLNLTVNARDAIKSRGEIEITTSAVDPLGDIAEKHALDLQRPHVMISVRDNGCGMDDETQSHMFEPFFTTKEQGKGTGLGLSTVHGIVKQAGGYIRVESEPGEGTVVSIFLPQVLADAEELATIRSTGIFPGSGTILLVEDESDVRKVVSRILQMSGYNVIEASGPLEALAIVEESGDLIDVLVTDVIMPVMHGRELHERVSEIRPEIKALYISGYAGGVMDESGILPDGVNFLQKPFAPEALLAKLHRILNEDF